MSVQSQFEREEQHIEEMYAEGAISNAEYRDQMRELSREYRDAMEEAAENAAEREREDW